jgi:flagellar motor switch protein FliM
MPMSEKTLSISFEMRMPEVQGSLNLCLPAVVLNTILRRLIGERDRPRRRSVESRAQMTRLVQDARFGAVLQFPIMRLNARELANITPGCVLRLPLPRQAMAELRVGGLSIFHAQPVRCGEQRGVHIQAYTDVAQRAGEV